MTGLRFEPRIPDPLQQHVERGHIDLTAAEVRTYAALMGQEPSRSSGEHWCTADQSIHGDTPIGYVAT